MVPELQTPVSCFDLPHTGMGCGNHRAAADQMAGRCLVGQRHFGRKTCENHNPKRQRGKLLKLVPSLTLRVKLGRQSGAVQLGQAPQFGSAIKDHRRNRRSFRRRTRDAIRIVKRPPENNSTVEGSGTIAYPVMGRASEEVIQGKTPIMLLLLLMK